MRAVVLCSYLVFQYLFNCGLLTKSRIEQTLKQVQGDNFVHGHKKAGFTLAEVLLVITIIGVVASLTIPNLVQNIQDQQLKAAWKKTYNILSEATDQIREENGGTIRDAWYNGGAIIPVYENYIKVIKRCNWPQAALNDCWASTTDSPLIAGAILIDGTFIQVDGSFDCMFGCGHIVVDVNGKKSPNECGIDIFKFDVLEKRNLPSGAQDSYWMPKACWANSSKYLLE